MQLDAYFDELEKIAKDKTYDMRKDPEKAVKAYDKRMEESGRKSLHRAGAAAGFAGTLLGAGAGYKAGKAVSPHIKGRGRMARFARAAAPGAGAFGGSVLGGAPGAYYARGQQERAGIREHDRGLKLTIKDRKKKE